METNKNNNQVEKKQQYTMNEFFKFLTQLYLGQMKRESFYEDNSHVHIYNEVIKFIKNKIETNSDRIEEYNKMLEVADRFYELVTNKEIREEIIKKDIRTTEFMRLYRERILGDYKRKYDMSDMINEDCIATRLDGVTAKKKKLVEFVEGNFSEHAYLNPKGHTIIIKELGKLYIEEWNGVISDISKYRIETQIGEDEYLVDEVYSNIRIIDMDNLEYRETVFNELLGDNNIMLSNTGGYIGEIINLPIELKNERVGTEKTVGGDTYFYKINENYALKYDGKDISAVMIFEQGKQIQSGSNLNSKRTRIKRQVKSDEKMVEENKQLDINDNSR